MESFHLHSVCSAWWRTKTQCQAVERTQPSLPIVPGWAATLTHEYARNGLLLVKTVGVGQSATVCCRHDRNVLVPGAGRYPRSAASRRACSRSRTSTTPTAPTRLRARRAAGELSGAMRLIGQPAGGWVAPVATCSRLGGHQALGSRACHLRKREHPGMGLCNGEGLSHHRAGAACRTPHGNASPMATGEALHRAGGSPFSKDVQCSDSLLYWPYFVAVLAARDALTRSGRASDLHKRGRGDRI